MSSGSAIPTGDITDPTIQNTYDFVVDQVGCSGASDTLECLRTVPADALVAAANKTSNIFGPAVRVVLASSWVHILRIYAGTRNLIWSSRRRKVKAVRGLFMVDGKRPMDSS